MHFAESESIAQAVGDLGKLFEFFALAGLKQIELLFAVGEGAEAYAQKADFAFAIEVVEKKFLKDGADAGSRARRIRREFSNACEYRILDSESSG